MRVISTQLLLNEQVKRWHDGFGISFNEASHIYALRDLGDHPDKEKVIEILGYLPVYDVGCSECGKTVPAIVELVQDDSYLCEHCLQGALNKIRGV